MAAELEAQEIRGIATYATDEPSENWSPAFWKKFSKWSAELRAYELQELAEAPAARRPAGVTTAGGQS